MRGSRSIRSGGPQAEAGVDGASRRARVERAKRGDHDAFSALVDDSADRLYGVAYRILRDSDLARDAVQQTLLSAWRDMRALRDPERFDAWLHRPLVRAGSAEARHGRQWGGVVQPLRQMQPSQLDAAGEHGQIRCRSATSPQSRLVCPPASVRAARRSR